ncbi:hypothetical protein PFISCL1PPCAC_27182, partial [Pristionchus fissidentatus]
AQFRLLLWKSLKNAFRTPIWTIFEIVLPLISFALLLYVVLSRNDSRSGVTKQHNARPFPFPSNNGKILYSCEEATCSETEESFSRWCSNKACFLVRHPTDSSDPEPVSHFYKFAKEEMNVTIYDQWGRSLMNGPTASSDEFEPIIFREPNQLGKLVSTFAAAASSLNTPMYYHPLTSQRAEPVIPKVLSLPWMFLIVFLSLVPMLSAINVTREISAGRDSNMKEFLLVMSRAVYYSHHLCFALLKSLPATVAISILVIIDQPSIGFHFLVVYILFVGAQISIAALISAVIKKNQISQH